ncbi:hypothetical protein BDN71DRAFT_1437070 [Pleurotus eryngii]|uniref:Uncharacterized protein n=1 Tax=Pleurotus eryngii TaxID=5323 RepID=A0A9P6D8Z0_PLEER|nr:hypothetical protein BDN71DRAFT_1437070 [Pleurotus eryngii]
MSVDATPWMLWEWSLMGCACHIGKLNCNLCEAYLYHVSTSWGANEKGLQDIVKTNNNVPQLQAQLSEMETKFSLEPSIAHIADLEDQIHCLTNERDRATRFVSQLKAKISMMEKESATELDHLEQICLLTAERDRAVILLNEQTELNRVQTSKSEASDTYLLNQERNNHDMQISQLRNEIEYNMLVLKNKESSNAHNQISQDLQGEQLRTADLKETIQFVEYSPLLDTNVRIKELGGKSNLDNVTDCNDDRYEERTIGRLLDVLHHNNIHSHDLDHDHDHDYNDTDSGSNSRKHPSSDSNPMVTQNHFFACSQIDSLNSKWCILPSWVPENMHISVVNGKWQASSDKEDALWNEALHLLPFTTSSP